MFSMRQDSGVLGPKFIDLKKQGESNSPKSRKLTMIIQKGEQMKSIGESSLSYNSSLENEKAIKYATNCAVKVRPIVQKESFDKTLSTSSPSLLKKLDSKEIILTDQKVVRLQPFEPFSDGAPRPNTSVIGR